MPPSTRKVRGGDVGADSSLARKRAALGDLPRPRAKRPIGMWTRRVAACSGSLAKSSCSSGVLTGPGQRALTRTPRSPNSTPSSRESERTAALGGGVGDLRDGRAHHRDERGGVDHRAAAGLEQVRDAVLAAEEDAAQVDVLDPLPGLERGVEHRGVVGRVDAGVVEEHVDAAHLLARLAVHVADLLLVGDVGRDRQLALRSARVEVDADDPSRPPRRTAAPSRRRSRSPRR